MNKKEMRKNIVENMDKIVRFVEREKRVRKFEELRINMVRIDEKNQTMYMEYEGKSIIGFILVDIVEKTRIAIGNERNCRSLAKVKNFCQLPNRQS